MAAMKRFLRPLLFLLAIGGLVAAYPYVFPPTPIEVDIFRAARGEVRETVSSPNSGTVVSRQEAVVAAEANGRVAKLIHKQGDRVEAGTPVVLLENADAAVEVRAAQASLATRQTAFEIAEMRLKKAEADLVASESLGERKLVAEEQMRVWRTIRDTTRGDVESARRAVREAEVAVERTQVALAKRVVAAPFAGVIRRKHVEAGEHVVIGAPCFEIYDDTQIFVRAPIDEVDIPKIRVGFPVDIALEPFGDRPFKGEIRDIEPGVRTAKELNRTGEVEVDILEAGPLTADASGAAYPEPAQALIRVGMSADIEVVTRTRPDTLRVLRGAVHETDDEHFVFIVTAGKIEQRVVKLGLTNWDYAEVLGGLVEGDAVVVSLDVKDLAAGKPAKIRREVKRPATDFTSKP